MKLNSPAFSKGEFIPKAYSCQGQDISPPLTWTDVPAKTCALALVCDDPDAPMGTWDHWVIYNIPAEQESLPKNVAKEEITPQGFSQGKNSWGNIGYGGPCPPGGSAHRYFFKLYALDETLDFKPGLSKNQLLKKIEDHIIETAELMGKFAR